MATVNPVQLQKYLKGLDHPASKADIVKKAQQEGGDDNVRATLDKLPDESFETPADVSQAVGKIE